jgi:hypothetical protein
MLSSLSVFATELLARSRTIVFIDLNNASAEIEAIRASLDREHDRLYVVPSLTKLDAPRRQTILKTTQQINALTVQSLDCAKRGRAYCETLWAQLRTLEQSREALTGAYTTDELIADIKAVVGNETRVDVLVISGHHSGSYFRGELAALEANDLLRFDVELAQQFGQTRSLLLLGCETGVPALMNDLFIKALPSLQLIAGAEDRAPTRNETRNLKFIRQLLQSEVQLSGATELRSVQQMYRTLLQASWPVSMLWRRSHFFSRDWQGPIANMPARVAATFPSAAAASPVLMRSTASAPPAVTSGPATDARMTKSNAANVTAPMLSPREAIDVLRSN